MIEVQSFSETFTSSLDFWRADEYLRSWKSCVESLFNSNFSVFLTDVSDPQSSNYIWGYKAFLLDNTLFIQQQIFIKDIYDLNDVIGLNFPKRHSLVLIDEDGEMISTWWCPADELNSYYRKLRLEVASRQSDV